MRHGVDIEAHLATPVKVDAGARETLHVKTQATVLCPLPCDLINHTLKMELAEGEVVLTRAAQIHAHRRHPEEFPLCFPHLAEVIADPLYVGDDFDNAGIELVRRVPTINQYMLVAVRLEINAAGQYEIASFYTVSEKKIESRRAKGFLKVAQKPQGPR